LPSPNISTLGTFAQQIVDRALIELAANVLRVVRGAGRPEDIVGQCADVLNAAISFDEKAGRWVSPYAIASAIHLEREQIDDYESFRGLRQLATRRMIRGSLQVAASKTSTSTYRLTRARGRWTTAFAELERMYEELRKERAVKARAARPTVSKKKLTKKPKPKVRL
jgi:electron transfer flavoprotein alpha subunit